MPQFATLSAPETPTVPAIPTATATASSVEICPTCGTRRTRRPYTPQPGDNALRVLRLQAGLSQVKLANLIGVYQPYVSWWEHARYTGLTAPRVQALAAALDVPAAEVRRAIRHLVWPLP